MNKLEYLESLNTVDRWGEDTQFADSIYTDYSEDVFTPGMPINDRVNLIEIEQPTKEVREAIENSYVTLPISVVVEIEGEYFKSTAEFGSYIEEWTGWKQVFPQVRTIIVYS